MRNLKQSIFTLYFLILIFSDEIFSAFFIMYESTSEKGMMQSFVVVTSLISYYILIKDIVTRRMNKQGWCVMFFIGILIFLYYTTQIFHTGIPQNYYTYFFYLCSKSLSAAIAGTHFALTLDSYNNIDHFLPLFIVPLALIIGTFGWEYALKNEIIEGVSKGLTYQSFSYWMAFFYTYCGYYLFFSPIRNSRIHYICRIAIFPTMLYSALMCVVGGGRGAFVYIISITLFLLYLLYKEKKKYIFNISFIIVLFAFLFIFFANNLDIWNSKGFLRTILNITNDESRIMLQEKALNVFYDFPLWGQGVGSIWWTVGIYSHNLFTDLLAETGIIGTVIIVLILYFSIKRLIQYSNINSSIYFLLFVFAGGFIQLMFSGYWIASDKIFLVCSFIFVYSSSNKKTYENYNASIRNPS